MTRRFLVSLTLAALVSGLIGAPVLAQVNAPGSSQQQALQQQPIQPPNSQPPSRNGSGLTMPFATAATNNGGMADVAGTFTINRFGFQNGSVFAVGTLAATVRETVGVRSVITDTVLPVAVMNGGSAGTPGFIQQPANCGTLHLELGPLNLDQLGLLMHLDRVVLDMSAQPGGGSLLGTQLCQINSVLGSGVVQNVNQLLGMLNQLVATM